MNLDFDISRHDALVVAFGFLAFVLLVAGAGRLARVLPVHHERRSALRRLLPVLGVLIGVGYVFWAAGYLLRDNAVFLYVAVLTLLVGFIGLAWPVLRDVIGSVFWKAGRSCREGDVIRAGGHEGRIVRLGLRVLTLETPGGDKILIPYSALLGDPVSLRATHERDSVRVFQLALGPGQTPDTVTRRAYEAALLSHGASLVEPPRIREIRPGELEVTVFTLWSEQGAFVERAVRAAVEDLGVDPLVSVDR
jgi:small-conductance mechanosensitive channel